LAKRVKQLFQDVSTQRMERDKTVSKQFAQNAEIGELKRELLKAQNEVNLATERDSKMKNELDECQKQKFDLIKDIEEVRKHKADMLEPALIASTKELKVDVMQRKHQVENLEKDLDEKLAIYDGSQQEIERLETEREKLAIALSKAADMPSKIM
jgi:hypothetical protein